MTPTPNDRSTLFPGASEGAPGRRGIRSAQLGAAVNALLALIKILAGIIGSTYALVADGIESLADIASSLIVWGGLSIAELPPDENHPFGHGKAEALAAALVSLLLLGAAAGIAIQSVIEIRTPHRLPAPWTLIVLVSVIIIKFVLARRVSAIGASIGSTAVSADARHHVSDAVTSAAAFIGITIALIGGRVRGGSGWESADDWAAVVAAAVIAYNGVSMLVPALHDLMDRMPGPAVVQPIRDAAESVDGVCFVEQLLVRKTGLHYDVALHVQADPSLTLLEAHSLGGAVKAAIRARQPAAAHIHVHMEPYLPS
jgi:cation diffusion facilitator family transporter